MTTIHKILTSVHGMTLGVDKDGNLVIHGTKILWGNLGPPSGTFDLTGGASGALFSNTVTATLASTQADYDPVGYDLTKSNVFYLTPAVGGSTIYGIQAAAPRVLQCMVNMSAAPADIIYLPNKSASNASAGNRFMTQNASQLELLPQTMAFFMYHDAISFWMFS